MYRNINSMSNEHLNHFKQHIPQNNRQTKPLNGGCQFSTDPLALVFDNLTQTHLVWLKEPLVFSKCKPIWLFDSADVHCARLWSTRRYKCFCTVALDA